MSIVTKYEYPQSGEGCAHIVIVIVIVELSFPLSAARCSKATLFINGIYVLIFLIYGEVDANMNGEVIEWINESQDAN